ncbi:MAG: DUF192 domain-containing protein [Ignavibacteriales bacterium]|nr:DUF192 domain-containing protein [Ignavibacteriales bacterium]
MQYIILAFIVIIVLLYVLVKDNKTNNLSDDKQIPPKFTKQGELIFLSKENDTLKEIDIELADDNFKRQRGLMYREKMDENQGMLFISLKEEVQSFWMKNTLLQLDIIFVNSKKEIVKIHKNAKPLDESIHYNSEKPAYYVVEVISGFCDKYKIQENDKINFVLQK